MSWSVSGEGLKDPSYTKLAKAWWPANPERHGRSMNHRSIDLSGPGTILLMQTIFSFLRGGLVRILAAPLALGAGGCSSESNDPDGGGGRDMGTGGSSTTGGSAGNAGNAGSTGVTGGNGGALGGSGGAPGGSGGVSGTGVGGTPTIVTVPCQGMMPAEDVSAAPRRVTAGGA